MNEKKKSANERVREEKSVEEDFCSKRGCYEISRALLII